MFEIIFTSGNGDTILQDDEFQAGNYGLSGTGAAANTTLTQAALALIRSMAATGMTRWITAQK